MTLHFYLSRAVLLLACLAAAGNLYLLHFPTIKGCAFPYPDADHDEAPTPAPLRLLAFGDPQLEGDSSFPKRPNPSFPTAKDAFSWIAHGNLANIKSGLRTTIHGTHTILVYYLKYAQKYIDLLGNDMYLGTIYRAMRRDLKPTHVTVLGDLLGSQWIGDEEFHRRSQRYWGRVFKRAHKAPWRISPWDVKSSLYRVHQEALGQDPDWATTIINVVGNHDIGYAGDITEDRVIRFENQFGPINADIRFVLPTVNIASHTLSTGNILHPSIRILVLNTMNLDGPSFDNELAEETIEFINGAISESKSVQYHDEATILLTHIPLHKTEGVCVDKPFFDYFPQENGGGVKEQNFLSYEKGRDAILQGIFGKHPSTDADARGMGRDGIILTGHDHEGCDVYHWVDRETKQWHAQPWTDATTAKLVRDQAQPGIREVTVRSMMGEFGGNAALIAAWWDGEIERWQIEVSGCNLGVQHIWWAVVVLDVVAMAGAILLLALYPSQPIPFHTQQRPATTMSSGTAPPMESARERSVETKRNSSESLSGREIHGQIARPRVHENG